MPQIVEKCVQELKRKGYSESEAWAICTSINRPKDSSDQEIKEKTLNCSKVKIFISESND